jgi:hypothetical protein
LQNFLDECNNKVILEVEPPTDESSLRRINFYKTIGFKLNDHNYIQPPYDKNKKPVKMIIMSYPNNINYSEFIDIRKQMHTRVYGMKKSIVILL